MKFINEGIGLQYIGIKQVESLIVYIDFYMDCAPAIILTIFFCKVKIFPLLEELPQKIIPYFIIEWMYASKLIWEC
jgi:hypothetical protein